MKKNNYINEIKQDLGLVKSKRSMMMESILCDDENYGMEDDVYMDDEEESNVAVDSAECDDVDSSINEIRQIALQTIAKLASNPTDEKYQLMKKIWTLCDKTIEDKINAAKGEKIA